MAGEQIKQAIDPVDALFANLDEQIAAEAKVQLREGAQRKRKAPKWEAVLQKFEETASESFKAKRVEGFVKAFSRKLGKEIPAELKGLVLKMKASAKKIEDIMKKLKVYADKLSVAGRPVIVEDLLSQTAKYPAMAEVNRLLGEENEKVRVLKEQIKTALMPMVQAIRDNEAVMEEMSTEELAGWEEIFGAFSQKEKPEQERIADAEAGFLLTKKEISRNFYTLNNKNSQTDFQNYRSSVLSGKDSYGNVVADKDALQQQVAERTASGLDLVDVYVQERVQALKAVREVNARPYSVQKADEAPVTFSGLAQHATRSFSQSWGTRLNDYQERAQEITGNALAIEFEARMVTVKDVVWKRYLGRVKEILEKDLPGEENAEKRNAFYLKLLSAPIGLGENGIAFKEDLFIGIGGATINKILKEAIKAHYLADLAEPLVAAGGGYNNVRADVEVRATNFARCLALLGSLGDDQMEKKQGSEGRIYYNLKFKLEFPDHSGLQKTERINMAEAAVPKEAEFINEIDAVFKFMAPVVSKEALDSHGYSSYEAVNPMGGANLDSNVLSGISKVGEARLPEDNLFIARGDTAAIPQLREARKRFIQSLSSDLRRITGESTPITRIDERQAAKRRVSKAEATALAAKAEKDAVKAEKDALEKQIRELTGQVAQLAGQTEQAQALRTQIEGQSKTNLEQVGLRIQRLEADKKELQQKIARLEADRLRQDSEQQKQMKLLQDALASPGLTGGNLKDAVRKFLEAQR